MDYKQAVEQKKTDDSPLHSRMDQDRELVELAQYVLKDVNDRTIPNALSIGLNDIAVFAWNVESALGAAVEQITVETEDKNLDTAYIEEFIKAAFASANARLTKRGDFLLNPFLDQQMCRRGRGAVRCFFKFDKATKELIPDIVPWDTRFFYNEMGVDGMEWGACETIRSKDRILADYPEAKVEEANATVLDIWTKKHNEVWVADEEVKTQPNPFKAVPIALQLVPMGSMLADAASFAHRGESIFFLIRDLIPELNRLVSIIQSLNQKALDNALLWKSQAGIEATPPKHDVLTKPGSVTPADIGGGAEPVNYGEIKRQAYLLHSMIETRIQRGSLSNLDLGIMGNQPWSAVALIEIGEGRDQVFLPRLGARGLLKQHLAEMFIDQVLQLGQNTVDLGTRGHKRTFDIRKLQGEYEITFKYFVKSPKTDIARFTMAAAAGDLVPNKFKQDEILQLEDPEGVRRQLRWEEAERLSPAVKMDRVIRGLLEAAKRGDKDAEREAELLSAQMGMTLKQMLAGAPDQMPKPEEAEKPEPMVPMFGGGSARKAAEMKGTPRAEEGEE